MAVSLWNISSGKELTTLIERSTVDIALPVANGYDGIEIELISGSLPTGTRIEGTKITGTAYEVVTDTVFTSVLRAHWMGNFDDRTVKIVVSGPDEPRWITEAGLLPVGPNNTFFILDNAIIDFQLIATDTDLSAGDELEFFIADGDGELPPGITLTTDGRLTGTTEPLLALDARFRGGGYDTMPYGDFPIDYAVLSSNGYGSFFYDTQTFDYSFATQSLRKLNRYYPFAVTVTDGENFTRREFKVYVVGDDFLRADNTVMQVSTGVFTADGTHVRTPTWITPRNLGFKRANNYTTIYLDILDDDTLAGSVVYTLEPLNDDGSVSELPPGMTLDSVSGEIVGRIPYQPAITQDYKFTIKAHRFTGDLEELQIFANFYEDVLLGNNSFKIYKTDLTGSLDGVYDLLELVGRDILLNGREYRVTSVDDRNSDYDVIFIGDTLGPAIPLILTRTALKTTDYLFVNRLTLEQKAKYQNRELRFTNTEKYIVTDIVPYLEYEIIQTAVNDPLLPSGMPRVLQSGDSYFVGDYTVFTAEAGGEGRVYRCIEAHTIQPLLDPTTGDEPLIVFGVTQIDFESSKWIEVAETVEDMSQTDAVAATKQSLEHRFGGAAYVEAIEPLRWRIRIPSTSATRNVQTIKEFFAPGADSTTNTKVSLLRDDEDRIQLDVNLSRQLNSGRNIGIALFKNEFFSETLVLASTDEVDIPSKAKTFELKVIGEIDSNISWITPADLGIINANFVSNLKVEAETTVPDTKMIYTLKSGFLPNGLRLNYNGDIIGNAKQFPDSDGPGLTTFDNKTLTWDGKFPGDTTFDRVFKFTIEARDRFGYTAIEREFTLTVDDLDNTRYTDIVARPLLKPEDRNEYKLFVADSEIFDPNSIYRPDDERFGIQRQIEMLVYSGIEAKSIDNFAAAAGKNHKRKRLKFGEIKKAIAREPGTTETIYEVIYVEVLDPAETSRGKTQKTFNILNDTKITVDSVEYAAKDDETKTGLGYNALPVYTRGTVLFLFTETPDSLNIITRTDDVILNVDNNDFIVDVREGADITVELALSDSEPQRRRPVFNTIKADSNAIKVSNSKDQTRYRSSIEHMRSNIKSIGLNERNYLPLWMRTPQTGFQELDFVNAIPICYCKPGTADDILLNIKNLATFDFKNIDFEIDRYIIKGSEGTNAEQYIIFPNYQFNV